MSMEIVSSSGYADLSKSASKPRIETTAGLEGNKVPINVVELSENSKTGDQYNGQNNGQKEGPASEKQIKNAINQANNKLAMKRTKCEFSYHEETKRISIKVVDQDTKEIIREIPPEETLQMVEKMWELAGILIDEKR